MATGVSLDFHCGLNDDGAGPATLVSSPLGAPDETLRRQVVVGGAEAQDFAAGVIHHEAVGAFRVTGVSRCASGAWQRNRLPHP